MNHRFVLESPKVTGQKKQKTFCPHCKHRRKTFTLYVDTENGCKYVNKLVGKCDRINHCGYHYTPHEYFRDNPDEKKQWNSAQYAKPTVEVYKPKPKFLPLSPEYVQMYLSQQSTFFRWLATQCQKKLKFSTSDLRRVFEDYMLGATYQSDVIFWQIDEEQKVHTGHIMQYGPDGHRLSYNDWFHSSLERNKLLPQNFSLYQCLFGQHLLSRYPDRKVCIVESEKTAVVLAALHPDEIWLATCSCEGLTPEKVECLKGRQVYLFPDSGCYDKWLKKMQLTNGINYVINDMMESFPSNTDLVDLLMSENG